MSRERTRALQAIDETMKRDVAQMPEELREVLVREAGVVADQVDIKPGKGRFVGNITPLAFAAGAVMYFNMMEGKKK